MNTFRRFAGCARLVLAFVITLGCALPAAAQQPRPRIEVSAGYVIVRDQDIYRATFPVGWNVDVAARMKGRWKIVGEVGGAYRNLDLLGTRFGLSVHTFMAGPRLGSRPGGRLAPFAQVLAGGERVGARVFGQGSSTTMVALQPGGGVEVRFTGLVGVRIGGDYRFVLSGGAGKEFRVVTAAVFRVGRK